MKKERLFFEMLDPKGNNYASKLSFYKSLKNQSVEDIEIWLSQHFKLTQILQLLSKYVKQEVEDDEKGTAKIRITQQQFDDFFSIIKQRPKEED
jgi:hypothetical protein